MIVIDDVWGDRAPDSSIGPAFGRSVFADDHLFFGAIDAREETF